MVGGRDEGLTEEPPREHRDVLVEVVREIEQAALAHQAQRLQALALVHVVEHPALVVGAEGGRPPALLRCGGHSDDHGVAKLGNRVRPPSTKMVWPVM